jgi:NAD(P)-dependent dehydrogenase (short-subunit alcohol dehydrogenase family)
MKTCVLLGSQSDIAKGLLPLLDKEYRVHHWKRGSGDPSENIECWDLCIIALGAIAPVGIWHEIDGEEWEACMESNLLLPLHLLRQLWPKRNPGANVCWFAGSNPNMIMDGYSAYNVSKMAVLKAVEQLDHESPDAKFFALGPGIVNTKIHRATLEAGWDNPKLKKALEEGRSTSMQAIYERMQWCIEWPKSVVGGRNVCVSDDIDYPMPHVLSKNLDLWKLRRNERFGLLPSERNQQRIKYL